MSRTSKDEWKLPGGEIVALSQDEMPPAGEIVWNGYDYEKQEWVYNGKKDTRSIEELRAAFRAKRRTCPACGQATLDPEPVLNSLSRYCPKEICNDCGNREAFEGDFWHGNALHGALRPGAN